MSKAKLSVSDVFYNVNIRIEKTVGAIKIKGLAYTCVYLNQKGEMNMDVNDYHIEGIEYQGIEIRDYKKVKKFVDFHKEMGIDYTDIVDVEVMKLTVKDVAKLAKLDINGMK
jgi:hypothetical protein